MKWWALPLFLALAAPLPAQDDPCPFYDGRRIFRDWRPLSHLLIAVSYRKECGLFSQADRDAVHSLHEARGCPRDSSVGRYFTDILDAPLNADTEHPSLAFIRREYPAGFLRFCRMADKIVWPDGAAAFLLKDPAGLPHSQAQRHTAFWDHLDATQNEITRLMKELGQVQ